MLSSDLLTKHVTREVMNVITGMTIGQLFGIDDTEPQPAPRVPKRNASKRKAAAKARRPTKSRSAKRSSKVFGNQMAKIMGALKSGPMAISELATATKLTVEALKLPLEKLMAAGDVRKTGNRRTTKYHLNGK